MGATMFQKNFLYKARRRAGSGLPARVYLSLICTIKLLKSLHVKLLTNFRPKYSHYNHCKVVKALFQKLYLQIADVLTFISLKTTTANKHLIHLSLED